LKSAALTHCSGGYIVRDANGQALAYLHSRDNPTEAPQAKALTPDEALGAAQFTRCTCCASGRRPPRNRGALCQNQTVLQSSNQMWRTSS
jgi:hypothetical protein